MSLKNLSRSEIFDAGAHPPPTRRRMGGDGVMVTEKIPQLRSEQWVNGQGHVVWLPLTTAAAQRNTNNPSAARRRELMFKNGGIPYAQCPVRTLRNCPDDMRSDTPCEPSQYSERRCCPHVQQIIAVRQAAHTDAEAMRHARERSSEQKRMDMLELEHQALMRRVGEEDAPSPQPGLDAVAKEKRRK